jgi:DNA-binding MarR family transcriptional regulator
MRKPELRTSAASPAPQVLAPTEVFRDHFPTLIAILANRLTRGASNYYRRAHGLGVTEFRILYALRETGDLSAFEIARVTDLDKAAVSRSMRLLEGLGYIRIVRTGKADRRIVAAVTEAGRAAQERLHAISHARQVKYLDGMSEAVAEQFRLLLTRMFAALVALEARDRRVT